MRSKRKRRQKISFIITLCVLLALFIFSAFILNKYYFINPKEKNNKISGWLHTVGRDIYDEDGKKIVIKGINYQDLTPIGYIYKEPDLSGLPQMCQGKSFPPQVLDPRKVTEMGFNAVRLVIYWDKLENIPPKISDGKAIRQWNDNFLLALDQVITQLSHRKIAVILDMHQYLWSNAFKYIQSEDGWGCAGSGIPGWFYPKPDETTFQKARCDFFAGKTLYQNQIDVQDLFLDAWKLLIKRYKNNRTVVGVNIINEPWVAKKYCSTAEMKLDNFYEKIGKEIKAINPNLLLIIEDSQDFNDGDFAVKNPPKLPNLVYSFHLYTSVWNYKGLERTERFLNRAKSFGLPLFIGEFDGFGWAVNDNETKETEFLKKELKEMMDYIKKNDIHWAFWGYSGYESIIKPDSKDVKKDILDILLRKGT